MTTQPEFDTTMVPDFVVTIKADPALTTQAAVREAIGRLQAQYRDLDHFAGALVDVLNTQEDDEIELYNIPDMEGDFVSSTNGTRLLWMPGCGRAALNSYQSGDWQWTDASSPQDALRRYREDDLAP